MTLKTIDLDLLTAQTVKNDSTLFANLQDAIRDRESLIASRFIALVGQLGLGAFRLNATAHSVMGRR